MKGTISKINPAKLSRNGNSFIRVEFKLENGEWAKTDLCPEYRNFIRWQGLLKVGNALDGIDLKKNGEVNADSYPALLTPKRSGHFVVNGNVATFIVEDEFRDDWKKLPEKFISRQMKLLI